MSCDSRTYQLIELNRSLPVKISESDGGTNNGRCGSTEEMHPFLVEVSTMHTELERQETVPKQITCDSDSNFAGCLQSRKSTSSCKIFYGKHLLKSTPATQVVVSLSSAQAEFYAAVKAAASGIGCVSMMRGLGVILQQQGVEVKAKGLVSKSTWMQQQAEPLQCDEVPDVSDISQPQRKGCNVP